jgi:hypothetical protein
MKKNNNDEIKAIFLLSKSTRIYRRNAMDKCPGDGDEEIREWRNIECFQ